MNISIRLKLDMAGRVRDFVVSHPFENAGYTAAGQRLGEQLDRAETLAQQFISGHRTVSGAIAAREQLVADIDQGLALLGGLVRTAARREPELAPGIARPDRSGSLQAYLTRARVAVSTAVDHADLLVQVGMPADFPARLGALCDRFELAINEKHAGLSAHVGARAELRAVTAEIMGLVQQIDALVRFQARNDAETLAAWRSARNVGWPATGKSKPADAPAGGTGKVEPAA
jgi:hypothetical protein